MKSLVPILAVMVASTIIAYTAANASEPLLAITNKPACCATEATNSPAVSARSLFQLDSHWTTDAGISVHLKSFAGKPTVITMFFASCQFACPLLVNDMKNIEAALPLSARTNVNFVLVSFDTERDTPEALAAYRKSRTLGANWTLLRGADEDVLELSHVLGVKFKKDATGQFSHSNIITILDAKGEVAMQQTGLNRDAKPAAALVLKKLGGD